VSPGELLEFVQENKEAPFRAKQISEWVWKKNVDAFEQMSNLSLSLRASLVQTYSIFKPEIASQQQSKDGTLKLTLQLEDNHLIEMVLIPARERVTVCISLQVGCALGCAFCATGEMGFIRNLEMYEIYEQVVLARKLAQQKYNQSLSNIVMMGMGEPLLNFDNVYGAIVWMTSANGMAMSPARITLSTVGIAQGIKAWADKQTGVQLAVSLHSANNTKRQHLMPVTKTNSLASLSQALVYYHQTTRQRITLEYLLLADVNDSLQDAQQLALFCKRFPVKINLIAYNPSSHSRFRASSKERTEAFSAFLESKNMLVQMRQSRGKDIDAACGQLVTQIHTR
jgi:23S rRNA (adenine2503-C2)-methyltransferase